MKYILTILFLSMAQLAFSQSDETETDSISMMDNVMIFKDARLDILEKRPALVAIDERARGGPKETVLGRPIVSHNGKKKVTGSIYTSKGFRIIVFNGSDRILAMQAKNKFSKAFSTYRSYMSYNVPSYKIKVGDFETKKEASDFLRQVSSMFPTSFIVPDIITVKNINVSE